MARADLLLGLTRSALAGDTGRARAVVEALASEERQKRHTVLASQLVDELDKSRYASVESSGGSTFALRDNDHQEFLREVYPKRRMADLYLHQVVSDQLELLIEEQNRSDLLRSFGVEPRHTLLLVGPSGNGKTSIAEALAAELALPLLVLRYEQVLTSFLGETANHLEKAISTARRQQCVLFLDEFDVVGKERGDEHEVGEIKRVVSSLLLQLDDLPSHVVLVAATNHSQLLDTAIWRRFELQLEISAPDSEQRAAFARRCSAGVRLSLSDAQLSRLLAGLGDASYADIEVALLALRRREILLGPAWSASTAKQEVSKMLVAWEARPAR